MAGAEGEKRRWAIDYNAGGNKRFRKQGMGRWFCQRKYKGSEIKPNMNLLIAILTSPLT